MKVGFMLDDGAIQPEKAHEWDAGFDLFAPVKARLPAHGSVTVDTGVHVAIPPGHVGMLKSKSGLNVKKGITCEGVIDAGYTGSVVAKLYNHGGADHVFRPGDKVTQIVIMPISDVELERVDSLPETERGSGGFGSTGR